MTTRNARNPAANPTSDGAQSAVVSEFDNGFLRVKDPRQRALLRILSFADRHRVAAAPLVERLACEYQGTESGTLRRVAQLLESGLPTVSALEQTPGAIDETTRLALRLAEESGTLRETYQLCLRDDADARFQADDPSYSPSAQIMQRAMGIVVACFVLTFLSLFIVPTFLQMMDEFGLAVPRFPLLLLWLFESFGFLLLLFSLAVIGGLTAFALSLRNWQWKPWQPVYPKRPTAVRLRALLALMVSSGRPLATALETLTCYQASSAIRDRLVAATQAMKTGEEPWSALARQKLLRPREAYALTLAPDGPTEQWLLQQAAVSSAHRHESVRGFVLRSVSFLLLVLLAVVVGLTAISFFMVLCELIAGLA